jgi:hypothetical protein
VQHVKHTGTPLCTLLDGRLIEEISWPLLACHLHHCRRVCMSQGRKRHAAQPVIVGLGASRIPDSPSGHFLLTHDTHVDNSNTKGRLFDFCGHPGTTRNYQAHFSAFLWPQGNHLWRKKFVATKKQNAARLWGDVSNLSSTQTFSPTMSKVDIH